LTVHRVKIRKSDHVLWHIYCRCGWFHGQVTYAATLRDALKHLRRHSDAGSATPWDGTTGEAGVQVLMALAMSRAGKCRMCGRPFSPSHDISAPGPTARHPFVPVGDAP
jgi:hypothetical protein